MLNRLRYSAPLRARWFPKAFHILPSSECLYIPYTLMTGIRVSDDEDWCLFVMHDGAPCLSDYQEPVSACTDLGWKNRIPPHPVQGRNRSGTITKIGYLLPRTSKKWCLPPVVSLWSSWLRRQECLHPAHWVSCNCRLRIDHVRDVCGDYKISNINVIKRQTWSSCR